MVKIMVNDLRQNLAINLYLKKKNIRSNNNSNFDYTYSGYMAM